MNGSDEPSPRIGLALSGGGVRAAVFHLGVLRRLAATGLLERVSSLSTVSGGSLVTAAVFAHSDGYWPTSERFLGSTYPALRRMITAQDLFSTRMIGSVLLSRHAPALFFDRARLLAHFLEERWGIVGDIADLPESPRWAINTTCLETGKNWRFSRREMGDWQFGRHYNPDLKIAAAVAASAAVPYAIGALRLDLPSEGWHDTDPATREPIRKSSPPATSVRLWDGGAYENLGLEYLYKPREKLRGCDLLICSDASGPLAFSRLGLRHLLRREGLIAPRLFDIASDQIRALRSRMLVRDFEEGIVRGALVKMGNSVRDIDTQLKRRRLSYDAYLPDADSRSAHGHPTDLSAPPLDVFDRLARHGFEAADATLTARLPSEFPDDLNWPGND